MKYIKLFLLAAFLSGCACYPEVPEVIFGGRMAVRSSLDYLDNIYGIFRVNGKKEEFTVYFITEFYTPAGNVFVKEREVQTQNLNLPEELEQAFKYWPLIFGWGSGGKDEASWDDIEIKYSDYKELEAGKLPGQVYVEINGEYIEFKINYGNNSSRKN